VRETLLDKLQILAREASERDPSNESFERLALAAGRMALQDFAAVMERAEQPGAALGAMLAAERLE
jgi:hypothetical protein